MYRMRTERRQTSLFGPMFGVSRLSVAGGHLLHVHRVVPPYRPYSSQ